MSAYQAILSLTLLLAGGVMAWIAWAGQRGTLRPNFWLGIRTTDLLRSEDAWRVGHRAAAGYVAVAAAGPLLAGVLIPFLPEEAAHHPAMISAVWLLVWVIIGSMRASAAAREI